MTTDITVFYWTIDGVGIRKTFGALESAREWAQDWVGANADLGSYYAVSPDGIGKITCEGVTIRQLFGREA